MFPYTADGTLQECLCFGARPRGPRLASCHWARGILTPRLRPAREAQTTALTGATTDERKSYASKPKLSAQSLEAGTLASA